MFRGYENSKLLTAESKFICTNKRRFTRNLPSRPKIIIPDALQSSFMF